MQIRAVLASALLVLSPVVPVIASAHPPIVIAVLPAIFDAEAAAQAHCTSDVVVWLNIPTHIYHEKGMRWYGRTKNGAYVCKKEADAAGDRDTRNGQ